MEEPAYSVYHMQPAYATTSPDSNQATLVSASAEVERAMIDLVGDLATYSPRSKVVILEGGSESKFDVHLVEQLFPTFAERVNLISGGNKHGVKALQVLLEKVAEDGKLDARFYSIVDRDYDGPELVRANHQYSWNVYHIENYLLNSQFIYEVINGLKIKSNFSTREIDEKLRKCAEETMDKLVRIRLNQWVHNQLIKCIDTSFDPSIELVDGFRQAAERSLNKMSRVLDGELMEDKISNQKEQIQRELKTALGNEQWKAVFRGRDILNRFVGQFANEINYEGFRNLIVNRMREVGYQPIGMKEVVEDILVS